MSNRLFFMIEGDGIAMATVKSYIESKLAVRRRSIGLLKEMGAADCYTSQLDGRVTLLRFEGGAQPKGFVRPKSRKHSDCCLPKKGTKLRELFDAQKGYTDASTLIQRELKVPCQIRYADGNGFRHIGWPFEECGFLYLGEKGPYAMWIPDVAAEEAEAVKNGATIEPSGFLPNFDGCRQIKVEEWEFIVAKHNLELSQAA